MRFLKKAFGPRWTKDALRELSHAKLRFDPHGWPFATEPFKTVRDKVEAILFANIDAHILWMRNTPVDISKPHVWIYFALANVASQELIEGVAAHKYSYDPYNNHVSLHAERLMGIFDESFEILVQLKVCDAVYAKAEKKKLSDTIRGFHAS